MLFFVFFVPLCESRKTHDKEPPATVRPSAYHPSAISHELFTPDTPLSPEYGYKGV